MRWGGGGRRILAVEVRPCRRCELDLINPLARAMCSPPDDLRSLLLLCRLLAAQLAETSMPLCMRNLAAKLKEHHHLRHGGRIQYGLFLKGIGLGLEEALVYWAGEFSKVKVSGCLSALFACTGTMVAHLLQTCLYACLYAWACAVWLVCLLA